jgi:hypothetical protein
MIDEVAELEPQADADASPEDRFSDDKSVDTSIEATEEPVEVDAETNDAEEEVESEADSSPADEENVEETIDAEPDEQFSNNVKGRIDELTSKWRDSERNFASLSQENEALRKQIAEKPVEVEPFKTVADFDYDEAKYQQYMATEIDKRATSVAEKVAGSHADDGAKRKAYDDFFTAEKEFAGTVKDYHKLVGDPDLKFSPAMAQATQVELKDPNLIYYLASNKDVAERLFNMSDLGMGIELGSIRKGLETEKAKAKSAKSVSDALPPVKKIGGSDPGKTKKITDSDITDSQFRKMREKQIANR